jgi:outer membrane protein, adhesin transport system
LLFNITLSAPRAALLCLLFNSLSSAQAQGLEQLISAALTSHPAAQVQQELTVSAQAGVDTARWQFYPTPSISAEKANASTTDPSYTGSSTVTTLRFQQPVWSGGRLSAALNKAEASVINSQATLEEVRLQLALRVVQSYGDKLAAHYKLQAYEKSQATHIRLREQVKRRIEMGASADSDLILAEGRLASLMADISVARTQQDMALARLGQLLGRQVEHAELGIVAPRLLNSSLQAQLALTLAANPSIAKAKAQAKMQEFMIAELEADFSPEVYVRAERQYGNYSYRNATPENRIFIGVSSRLGAGLSTLSTINAAKSQHRSALAEIEVQSRSASEQVLNDYALATAYENHIQALNDSLQAAAAVSDSYDRQFLAGRKTWQDVMNAARELAQNEVLLTDSQAAQVIISWRLAIYTLGVSAVIQDAKL